jgi:hypothetical protein
VVVSARLVVTTATATLSGLCWLAVVEIDGAFKFGIDETEYSSRMLVSVLNEDHKTTR